MKNIGLTNKAKVTRKISSLNRVQCPAEIIAHKTGIPLQHIQWYITHYTRVKHMYDQFKKESNSKKEVMEFKWVDDQPVFQMYNSTGK